MNRYRQADHFASRRRGASALTCLWLTCAAAGAAHADPTGTWLTADGQAHVRVADCGGTWCGTIVWLREPNDPATGRPLTDQANADVAKRTRLIIGMPVVFDMRPGTAANKWSGQLYDPRNGKTYNGSMLLETPARLKIDGCVLVLCESEIWTRVIEPGPPQTQAPQPARPRP